MKHFNIQIDEETYESVRQVAFYDRKTIKAVIAQAVAEHVAALHDFTGKRQRETGEPEKTKA